MLPRLLSDGRPIIDVHWSEVHSMSHPWATPDVTNLIRCIMLERRWSQLPVLADALEDAGCQDLEFLAYLRDYKKRASFVRSTGRKQDLFVMFEDILGDDDYKATYRIMMRAAGKLEEKQSGHVPAWYEVPRMPVEPDSRLLPPSPDPPGGR